MSEGYKGILFTDLDGTWKRDSMFLDIVHEMVKVGLLSQEVAMEIEDFKVKWEAREGSFDDYMMKAVRLFESNLAGVSVVDYESVVDRVLRQKKNNVYRFSRALVQKKIDDGWYVCVVSASPESAVKAFARMWGIHEAHGTKMFDEGGVFTGERKVLDRELKQKVIRAVLAKHPDILKENIWACGDSMGDAPMLLMEEVGRGICVNPSSDLMQEVFQQKYEVVTKIWFVVERKDVIYEWLSIANHLSFIAYRVVMHDMKLLVEAGNDSNKQDEKKAIRMETQVISCGARTGYPTLLS